MMMRLLILSLVLVVGCTKKTSPEVALRKFVNYRFSGSQDKEWLLNRLTGIMYKKIDEMEDSEIETFINVEKLKKQSLKIVSKKCEQSSCYLTYIVAYSQKGEASEAFEVEVKKIAELTLFEDGWKIADIRDVKTFIDSSTPLTP